MNFQLQLQIESKGLLFKTNSDVVEGSFFFEFKMSGDIGLLKS